MMAPSHADILVRLALILMAQDPTAALTEAQRVWIQKRCKSLVPFSATERARVQEPVLAYAARTMHASTREKLMTYFAQETSHDATSDD